jgi:hypothetical protein
MRSNFLEGKIFLWFLQSITAGIYTILSLWCHLFLFWRCCPLAYFSH